MLVDGRCTIYEDRPLVCRTYDCRIYAATGVAPDRAEIAAQVRRWRFSYPAAEDRELHDAVLAAARFVREQPGVPAERGGAAAADPRRHAGGRRAREVPGRRHRRRRAADPSRDRDRIYAVADANEELFGDG